MIITTDDLCLSYLDNFRYFDEIRNKKKDFEVVAFTIGNFKNKENLRDSGKFIKWFEEHRDWVEIAVHSYDHLPPPDGDRHNEETWIRKALVSLKPFLPKKYGYRSPGWQTTNKTVPILKKLGFSYIAYESRIADIQTNKIINKGIINTHLYDTKQLRRLKNEILQDNTKI